MRQDLAALFGVSEPGRVIFTLNGTDALKQPEELRQQLGYLPQDFGVYPRISALDMLDHLASLKGFSDSKQRREIVEALLVQTNLFDVRKKALAGFSGGMRQRFGIAQALIGDPRLIIVDEPTAGLDPEERNRFLNLLSDIGENKVVILSTHIVEDVTNLCPRMAIIARGEIVTEGRPAELIGALAGSIWIKTVERNEVDSYKARHTVISSHLYAGRCILHVLNESHPGDSFEPHTPDLEDVYFATLLAHGDSIEEAA